MDIKMITTTFNLKGYSIKENLGIVKGVSLRTRNVLGAIGATIQTVIGTQASSYLKICEKARQDALDKMIYDAELISANAIVGMRFENSEISPGISEILCYGTAVLVEKE